MIFLMGSEGSMGKRYQAIFRYLELDYIPFDHYKGIGYSEDINKCDKVLIAIPTDYHSFVLRNIIPMGKDILCEKPVCKSSKEVSDILDLVKKSDSKFNMVFQYGEIAANNLNPHQYTYYDYFRTGNDGLAWDCLQIVALASGPIKLKDQSPIWKCEINDQQLELSSMDYAYVKFIKKWALGHLEQDHEWLIGIHKKVEDYVAKLCT